MDPSRGRLLGALIGAAASGAAAESIAAAVPVVADHPMVARVRHGRRSVEKADEDRQYLFDVRVKKIATLPGKRPPTGRKS